MELYNQYWYEYILDANISIIFVDKNPKSR